MKIAFGLAALALCLAAPVTSAPAGERVFSSDRPIILAESRQHARERCQSACTQQYNTCRNADREHCLRQQQRCWNSCSGR